MPAAKPVLPASKPPDLDEALLILREWARQRCPHLRATWVRIELEGGGKAEWIRLPIPVDTFPPRPDAPAGG